MAELFMDCLLDTLKLIPFLFCTYLLMEYIEHRSSKKMMMTIRKAGRMGPLFGGILGIVPQCGFSAAAAGFFSGKVITVGTLIAVFLSTSDEMLPIFISSQMPIGMIVRIVLLKAIIGVIAGFIIDFLFRKFNQRKIGESIHDICDHDKCQKEEGLLGPALSHTLQITVFIFFVTLVINLVIGLTGEEQLGTLILNRPLTGHLLAGLAGLIPNCAASVVITTLYLNGMLGFGAMMSGLFVGAGVGVLVLFRTNKSRKENLQILGILYASGVLAGMALDLLYYII